MREERTGPKKKIVNACASRLSGFRPVTNRPFAREVANHDRQGLLPYPSKEERSIPPKGSTHRGFATKPKATGR